MSDDQTSRPTLRDNVRAIRFLFFAIITGAVIFATIVLGLNYMTKPVSPFEGYEMFVIGAMGLIYLICVLAARHGYNRGMEVAKDSLISTEDKLNQYRTALIKYLALLEAPALLGIILFFITGNYFMLIVTVLAILAMLYKMPTRQRMIDDLGLDWKQ